MKVAICAVGRCRSGPERDLVDDYARRFDRAGRPLSLGPLALTEVESKRATGMAAEADALRQAIRPGGLICALDERGAVFSSPQFADWLARRRDGGCAHLTFVIGGADGLDPALRDDADARLCFGPMVWPHLLARVMLAEQLYRAASILAGSPYHRA
ncbi:rRNA large subunit methyltransferase [Oceaniovalibus guishaninsula JLT2003]|uniref:Ribosomal RNA large subunit methyltransferase H n=1 Tax=Oceaniovalibus guishaninsula JLT2003 TaxID=1231392 RepID=K2HAH8_9RHOB|nr:23S rRNA (pseudouridine(1915)-N(3))-methyltransferase RlmH [Oceaniovalibus guishaninsula]EKE44533.1 rRNA large subunit methyltransferase [Oceaniovalibus guishaninsula JLT2003]